MTDARADIGARRASFGSKADAYERYRPGYPSAAIDWVVGSSRRRVIDIGCGPGNLTVQLKELGHDVVGVDGSAAMLERARSRGLRVVRASAEALPLAGGCAEVVTAATAFHWFDHARAVPEMRRVLVKDGRVGLVTNMRDERVPWVKALSDIIGSENAMAVTLGGAAGMETEFVAKLEGAGMFHATEHRVFDHVQELTPDGLLGLVGSRSYIAILPEDERTRLLDEVGALCRDHPDLRGRQSFLMPYETHVIRAMTA